MSCGKSVSNITFQAKSTIFIVVDNVSFRAILLTVGGCESNIAYNSSDVAHAFYQNSTVASLCNGGDHQRLLNEAILHNKLVQLFPLPM